MNLSWRTGVARHSLLVQSVLDIEYILFRHTWRPAGLRCADIVETRYAIEINSCTSCHIRVCVHWLIFITPSQRGLRTLHLAHHFLRRLPVKDKRNHTRKRELTADEGFVTLVAAITDNSSSLQMFNSALILPLVLQIQYDPPSTFGMLEAPFLLSALSRR